MTVQGLKVRVEYLGHARSLVGNKREEQIELQNNASIGLLMTLLCEKYGEPFRNAIYETGATDVKANFMITVNGNLLNQLDGVETKLKQNDRIVLMPVVSGG